ncbi:MAG: asparagine synthase (glutamine-hydrolyzing) [Planctomycetes bacterium RIFCSPLOWO2_12_FULL_40_19]|nr:MAG: asparagine synthase (glutamine-hydrolyzing) [Planctomycetes bacterium RIFCSPLOWO2_12_FULL_40_19]
MCGIFGVAGEKFRENYEQCALTLIHRGPDDFGSHLDQKHSVYLAHNRLAIIDLSENGRQPMCNEDGTIWLTCNGEIYNFIALRDELKDYGHKFSSDTDSEVILHAYEEWGLEGVKKFTGMFAFAIWDSNICKLYLVRDRVGIKPLYYWHRGNTFAFASEPKALIALPFITKKIDYGALFQYLLYGYVQGRHSIWDGIQRLLPGRTLQFDTSNGYVEEDIYWKLEVSASEWSVEEAIDRLDSLMKEVVRDHLVSDVPLGAFLSGGIDSSCVVAYTKEYGKTVNTFTIGFEEGERDERDVARSTAKILETNHFEHAINITNFNTLKQVFNFFDEPFACSSMFPMYMACNTAKQMVKVVLSGDGGDELFCGYEWYTLTENCRRLKKTMFLFERLIRMIGLAETELGKRCNRLEHYRRMSYSGFSLRELHALFPEIATEFFPVQERDLLEKHWKPSHGRFKQWQYIDAMTIMVDSNLTTTDRTSMANSLEVRVPLLDHRIVEFAFQLRDSLLVNGTEKKFLLRQLLKRRGLNHLLALPKSGFSCPVSNFWSTVDMRSQICEYVLVDSGIMSKKAIDSILNQADNSLSFNKLYYLAALDQWCRRWYA